MPLRFKRFERVRSHFAFRFTRLGVVVIAAALAVFDRVGLEHVKIAQAPQACAGYPLLAAGHRDLFRWHAGRVATAPARCCAGLDWRIAPITCPTNCTAGSNNAWPLPGH